MSNDNPAAAPEQLSLRQKTTRGAMWIAGQSMVTRVVVLVQQLLLAWLLEKSDFGLIGLATTVTAIANWMANPGGSIASWCSVRGDFVIGRHRRSGCG